MLFVYWFEEHPEYVSRVSHIHARMAERGDTLHTSVFTMGEVLTGPCRGNDRNAIEGIRKAFRSPGLELLPFTESAADRYAAIRGKHRVSSGDAIHLATAGDVGIDLFLTNDRELHSLVIPGIEFIAGLDTNLF